MQAAKKILEQVITEDDAQELLSVLVACWQKEDNHQKLIDYYTACKEVKDALEVVARPLPELESKHCPDSISVILWCEKQYSLALEHFWKPFEEKILESVGDRLRSRDLWRVVTQIALDAGIPEADLAEVRIGAPMSGNKMGRLISQLTNNLVSYGKRKDVRWWTREKIDGVSYLVKTSTKRSNLLDFPAANQ